jgi:glycosyltransferase involved in cell wall biosynthesis
MRVAMLLRCLGMMRGGGETRHLAWIRELTALGVDVEILTGRPLFASMRHPESGATVIRSPYTRDIVYRLQNRRVLGRVGSFMLHNDEEIFCRAAWRRIASESPGPDVVHAHALHQAARLRRGGVPVVISLPGPPHPRYHADLGLADALVSDGWGAKRLPGILQQPVAQVTKGVDSQSFRPDGPSHRSQLGLEGHDVVLCASRLVPIKNVALFVDAMAIVHRRAPNARAIVAGDGPERHELRRRAAALGLGDVVRFAGHVPQEDLPSWYRAADVFALSSDFDNSPNVVLEAMASGLATVATDVGGVSEFLEPPGGILVQKGDAQAMAHAVLDLLSNPAKRRDAGDFNRHRAVTSFSWRRSAEQLLAVYERAISARRRAA